MTRYVIDNHGCALSRLRFASFIVVLLCASIVAVAYGQADAAQAHVAAAKAAVAPEEPKPYHVLPKRPDYHNYQPVLDQFCTPPKLPDTVRQEDRGDPQPIKNWYAPPAWIFDNLYFIGTKSAGIFAVSTSEGIIVIDTNFDWDIKELVLGLLQFGLDPKDIKYVIVTHAHDDRYWGARTLQDTYPSVHIVMSGPDWDLVAKNNDPARVKPKKDMVATDGQKLKLGDVTITMYVTPGHTPGTLSLIIDPLWNKLSIQPDNVRHVASLWGGADINIGRAGVQYWPDGQTMMKTYIASLKRFVDLGEKAGADTLLTDNMRHGNIAEKIRVWRIMNPDESGGGQVGGILENTAKVEHDGHPFVSKDAVKRFYTVLGECYQAQLAWRF